MGGRTALTDPVECVMCGHTGPKTPRFLVGSFQRHGDVAAFRLSSFPPIPHWRMAECPECGAVSPVPYPPATDVENFYALAAEASEWEQEHYVRLDRNPKALAGADHLAAQLTRLLGRPVRLLEVGCAAGWVLKAARDRGWEVRGVEAAPKFATFAIHELGLDVTKGALHAIDTSTVPPQDVVMAFDVFEHLHDPVRDLRVLRRMVSGQGYLLLTTPNIASRVARFYGLRWRQVIPTHVNYSTPKSMRKVLARTGWRLEHLSEPRYWDPDPFVERRQRWREVAKFVARAVLAPTIPALGRRVPAVRGIPRRLSHGRVDWAQLLYRIGDQPVLGDVLFVVARPA